MDRGSGRFSEPGAEQGQGAGLPAQSRRGSGQAGTVPQAN